MGRSPVFPHPPGMRVVPKEPLCKNGNTRPCNMYKDSHARRRRLDGIHYRNTMIFKNQRPVARQDHTRLTSDSLWDGRIRWIKYPNFRSSNRNEEPEPQGRTQAAKTFVPQPGGRTGSIRDRDSWKIEGIRRRQLATNATARRQSAAYSFARSRPSGRTSSTDCSCPAPICSMARS